MQGAKPYTLLIGLAFLAACGGPSQLSFDEAEPYLINHMSEQAVTHAANGYEVEVKQLPTSYLALREVKTEGRVSQPAFDSAVASYGDGAYFLLSIKPQTGVREGDIMMQDVYNYEEYQERFLKLSFSLRDHITLEYEGGSLSPVLANVEHGYGLAEHRSAMLAFAPSNDAEREALQNGAVTVVFDDRIFQTGISRFPFNASSLNNLPPVRIASLQ